MKIMLIGSTDLSGKTIGGQYEKTRLVYKFLNMEENVVVNFCNMFDVGRTIGLFTAILKGYRKCDSVVVITSTRGTKVISSLFYYLKKIKCKPIVYLIVGNQQNLLKTLPKRIAKGMDKLYFEVSSMQEEVKDKYNVGFFSNCKDIQISTEKHVTTNPIRICYYSEISFRKGFDRIVRALDVMNKESIKYEMDVFGYYADDEVDMKKILTSRTFLKFKGIVKRESAHEVLSKYSFMVFPSRHKLEGVPGAVVDAYEAGLPVVCSKVGFLSEVVKDGQTGFLFENEEQLIEVLKKAYNDPEMIEKLRENVITEAQKYDIKESIERLHNDLTIMIAGE